MRNKILYSNNRSQFTSNVIPPPTQIFQSVIPNIFLGKNEKMDHEYENCDGILKLLIVGDSGVGKSNFLLRAVGEPYSESHNHTIALDFRLRRIKIKDKKYHLQIWDTAGQKCFQPVTTQYYRGSRGAFVVYDVTKRETFTNIKQWIQALDTHAGKKILKILIGNKCDLKNERAIEYSEAKKYADELGIPFLETSARDETNIEEAFVNLVNRINDKGSSLDEASLGSFRLEPLEPKISASRPGCC